LLVNSSFEAGTNPTPWTIGYQPAGATVNYVVYSNAGAADGGQYLEANTSITPASMAQTVTMNVSANQSYTFSIWLRAPSGTVQTRVALWGLGGTKNES